MSFSLASFDLSILRYFTQFSGRSEAFDVLVQAVARYTVFKGALLFSLLWLLWFRGDAEDAAEAGGRQACRRRKLISVLLVTVASVCLARLMQRYLWIHPRPFHMNLGLRFPDTVDPSVFHPWNSFPSDHAVYFFALATGIWTVDRKLGLAAFLWTLLVICLPRVYLGIHHPSDIVGGGVIGVLCMLLALRSSWLRALARRIHAWGTRHPGTFYWLAFLLTLNAATLFNDIRSIARGLRHILAG